MAEKWYDDLGENIFVKEEDKIYFETIEKIKTAVKNGMGFDEACDSVNLEDSGLKELIVDDSLKVLIAELYFTQGMSTDKVAELLKIPVERVNSAKENMLKDVEETTIKAYRQNTGTEEP